MDIFLATGLSDARADSGEDERIEVIAWPLDRLDEALARTTDAKTLIGLLLLKERLQR
jgi:ADP-ribose pyrophosphatase